MTKWSNKSRRLRRQRRRINIWLLKIGPIIDAEIMRRSPVLAQALMLSPSHSSIRWVVK
jgi:hypothetical protein